MPVLTYTLQRLGLLLLAAVALFAVGMRGWLIVIVATLVGWALSYVILPRQRDAAARWLAARDARRKAARGPDEDALAEDAEAEAVRRRPVGTADRLADSRDGAGPARVVPESDPPGVPENGSSPGERRDAGDVR